MDWPSSPKSSIIVCLASSRCSGSSRPGRAASRTRLRSRRSRSAAASSSSSRVSASGGRVSSSRNSSTAGRERAPVNSATTSPFRNALTAGIPETSNRRASSLFASTSIFASTTSRPSTAASSTGVSRLHGPHHSAQKSTTTGSSRRALDHFGGECLVGDVHGPQNAAGAASLPGRVSRFRRGLNTAVPSGRGRFGHAPRRTPTMGGRRIPSGTLARFVRTRVYQLWNGSPTARGRRAAGGRSSRGRPTVYAGEGRRPLRAARGSRPRRRRRRRPAGARPATRARRRARRAASSRSGRRRTRGRDRIRRRDPRSTRPATAASALTPRIRAISGRVHGPV